MTLLYGHRWHNFSERINANTKISCEFDKDVRMLYVDVYRRNRGQYEVIRTARVAISIDSPSKATWVELYLPEELRGEGIGSAIVKIVLNYLKRKGVTEVGGKISHGDAPKALGFWKKNGFTVIPYGPDDRTGWAAEIACVLTCHSNYG